MGYLAAHRDEGPTLSQTIADEMNIPKNFLSKIMNRLVQAGLVRSVRGTGGGFVMDADPGAISLQDVVGLFMKLDSFKHCFLNLDTCDASCGMHKKWLKISNQIEDLLVNTYIQEVM